MQVDALSSLFQQVETKKNVFLLVGLFVYLFEIVLGSFSPLFRNKTLQTKEKKH